MISTYIVGEYEPTDKTVEVTYINENNFEHKRIINIPHLQDGSIDEDYFQEILESQLRGVENKVRLGIITFNNPETEL
jgi:hypothetical protein